MKLYEIKQEIISVIESGVDQETGELSQESIDLLDSLELMKEEKCLNIAKYVKTLEAESSAFSDAIKRISERKSVIDNKAARLKNYLAFYADGEKFADPEISISWRKSKALEITESASIPKEFIVVKVTESPDKNAIKKAIESGAEIEGCFIAEKSNIQIK